MEQCLIDNKVCSNQNKKCKECKLDDCKRTIEMIDEEEYFRELNMKRKLDKELPEQCKSCSFLEITDLSNLKVHCPYMIKNNCILNCEVNK